ncbi:MAG: GNAT family N-acetyltransferase [Rhodoferax sp.]|nr:GNAT family N-acetyltransferase [Rhodoferax sp.]MBP9928523.1 GNAT family N-acetyltransferase [Rhodoferax sp.]HQX60460.1 GNAT family protein [Burkholderiaceae bacterium]HQZ06249.1 GNAT family protein [Burkholderiaceae bacterium]
MNAQTNSLGQPIGVPLRMVFPRPRPPATPLHGRFCSVVPTDVASHAGDLFDAFSADTLGGNWTYLPYGPFDTLAAMQSWMQTTCTGSDPLFHTILDSKGHPQGLASYLRIEPATGVIEVGHIHLANAVQRTPAATEAMFLMMNRVFDELGYRRYEWKCDALNEPSRRAALRLGFRFEGIFRNATHYKGRNRDTAWFSVIDDEWPALRAAFEQWLSPANVDAQGRQLRRIDELRNHASSTG